MCEYLFYSDDLLNFLAKTSELSVLIIENVVISLFDFSNQTLTGTVHLLNCSCTNLLCYRIVQSTETQFGNLTELNFQYMYLNQVEWKKKAEYKHFIMHKIY